ncbi:hypothetical protein GGR52DRAFT_181567 [Hypoxylon sp. FL1284]|nr:hypothetical protein GGR52DRAFT_181567 [Hypoxylon sp. FL1284]
MENSPGSNTDRRTSGASYASVTGQLPHVMTPTSTPRQGKLVLRSNIKNSQRHRSQPQGQEPRLPTTLPGIQSSSDASVMDSQDHVDGGQRSSSATSFRIQSSQQAQTRSQTPIPPIHHPDESNRGSIRGPTLAVHNVQVASMQATLTLAQDDLARRTSELIEAKTDIAVKDSIIEQLKDEIESLHIQLDNTWAIQEANAKNLQTILDYQLENEELRESIHTGIISIAQVYGTDSSREFTVIAEKSMNKMRDGQTSSEPSGSSSPEYSRTLPHDPSQSPSPEPSRDHSPERSAGSSSGEHLTTPPGSADNVHSLNSPIDSNGSSDATVVYNAPKHSIPLKMASGTDDRNEVDQAEVVQESRRSEESHKAETPETAKPKTAKPKTEEPHTKEAQASQSKSKEPQTPLSKVKETPTKNSPSPTNESSYPIIEVRYENTSIPTGSSKASDQPIDVSAERKSEIHSSPASRDASSTNYTATATADDTPKSLLRSYANVASSPPGEMPESRHKNDDGKTVGLPQATGDTTKTRKSVSSVGSAPARWRDRAIEEQEPPPAYKPSPKDASNKNAGPQTPSSSKAKSANSAVKTAAQTAPPKGQAAPKVSDNGKGQLAEKDAPPDAQLTTNANDQGVTSQAANDRGESKPAEKEQGWENVKSKNKTKKNKKSKVWARNYPAIPTTNNVQGNPMPKEAGNGEKSTPPQAQPRMEKVAQPRTSQPQPRWEKGAQAQPRWKRHNGTVIGSNSIFSQSANKKDGNDPSIGPGGTPRGDSLAGGKQPISSKQPVSPPKRPGNDYGTSTKPKQSKTNWADEMEGYTPANRYPVDPYNPW